MLEVKLFLKKGKQNLDGANLLSFIKNLENLKNENISCINKNSNERNENFNLKDIITGEYLFF